LSLAGGSAAKVSEVLLTKIKSKQQKKNEFFDAHPAGSVSGVSGMSGCVFFGYFLCRIDKESD
jgi:hypothetical protein